MREGKRKPAVPTPRRATERRVRGSGRGVGFAIFGKCFVPVLVFGDEDGFEAREEKHFGGKDEIVAFWCEKGGE